MTRILAVLLVLTSSRTAFSWGHAGHQTVGAIADKMLNQNAAAKVHSILGTTALRTAASWADCAKDVERQSNGTFKYKPMQQYAAYCGVFSSQAAHRRFEDYVKRNYDTCTPGPAQHADPCHKQYHYTDVCAEHDHYDRSFVGTSDQDVVHAIEAAIAVLQGNAAPAPISFKDKKEALLVLSHLVGDVHQPLHVGAVYLDSSGQRVDPDAPGAAPAADTETRGGNNITDGTRALHGEWDDIPTIHLTPLDPAILADANAASGTAGSPDTWPAKWATETVMASHDAFNGLTFQGAGAHHWTATVANRPAYLQAKADLQKKQLAKGGARLAQLLNAIWP